MSSIRSGKIKPKHMYVGSRFYSDIGDYINELNELDINTYVCLTSGDGAGYDMRVSELLELNREEHPSHTHYYLCGLSAMIEDCTYILQCNDVPESHIHHECFFNSDG
jgi:ferredoxin-NADP reductase